MLAEPCEPYLPDADAWALGCAVRADRIALDVTVVELAEATGVHRSTISKIESGRSGTTVTLLGRLAVGLAAMTGADPTSLLAGWTSLLVDGGRGTNHAWLRELKADPTTAAARRYGRRRRTGRVR